MQTMRRRGWTEAEVAERILPYMPPMPPTVPGDPARGGGEETIALPARVSTAWLDGHLPAMDRRQLRLVVEELERRGWSAGELAMTVLPHLLPQVPPADAEAILEGLRELGMTEEEISRLSAGR